MNGHESLITLTPGARLSDLATMQLLEELVVLKAKRVALESGVPVKDLHRHRWAVHVDPVDLDPV